MKWKLIHTSTLGLLTYFNALTHLSASHLKLSPGFQACFNTSTNSLIGKSIEDRGR